jgi:hypothetical protein
MIWTRRDVGRLAAGAGAIAALRPGFALGATHGTATTISHGVSAFSDLKYPDGFSHFDYANPDAPVGGTFSTGYGGVTFDSLNPFILKGNPAIGLDFLFDSLMVSADDEADSLYGLVAKSVEIPEDRLWATFELREEARFSDGSPITAEDVVFTFETLRDKGSPVYKVVLAAVTNVTAEGPLRVRYDFHPAAPRRDLPMTVAGLNILSKAYYQTHDFSESTMDPPLGSGPSRGLLGLAPAGEPRPLELRAPPFRGLPRPHRLLRGVQGGNLHLQRGVLVQAVGHWLRLPGDPARRHHQGNDPRQEPQWRPRLLVQPAPQDIPGSQGARGHRDGVRFRMV